MERNGKRVEDIYSQRQVGKWQISLDGLRDGRKVEEKIEYEKLSGGEF